MSGPVIKKICEVLNVKCIEELMGGLGLLSKLLSNNLDFEVSCTDGY